MLADEISLDVVFAEVRCPIPSQLANAKVSKNQVLEYQDEVEYDCNEGYDTVPGAAVDGDNFKPKQTLTCTKDGHYSPSIKTCSSKYM